MIKKSISLLLAAFFLLTVIGCGHFKKPFKKKRGKRRGHSINMIINKADISIST
jgi:hypothetical protein